MNSDEIVIIGTQFVIPHLLCIFNGTNDVYNNIDLQGKYLYLELGLLQGLLLKRNLSLLCGTVPALSSTVPALSSTVPALSSTVPALSSTVPALSSTVPALSSTVPALSSTVPALSRAVLSLL